MNASNSFLNLARSPAIVKRASKIALIVGTILATINYGDIALAGELTGTHLIKIAMTFLVPYCVSTYSAVQAMRDTAR